MGMANSIAIFGNGESQVWLLCWFVCVVADADNLDSKAGEIGIIPNLACPLHLSLRI